jgi:hypothetical protein
MGPLSCGVEDGLTEPLSGAREKTQALLRAQRHRRIDLRRPP